MVIESSLRVHNVLFIPYFFDVAIPSVPFDHSRFLHLAWCDLHLICKLYGKAAFVQSSKRIKTPVRLKYVNILMLNI